MSEFGPADYNPADYDMVTDWLHESFYADPPDVDGPPPEPSPPNPRCTCGHGLLLHSRTGLCVYGHCDTFTPKEAA